MDPGDRVARLEPVAAEAGPGAAAQVQTTGCGAIRSLLHQDSVGTDRRYALRRQWDTIFQRRQGHPVPLGERG